MTVWTVRSLVTPAKAYRLIQLQDCPHVLDVDNLDNLMNSETETIQMKACPFCRQPIVNTYRYKDMVSQILKNEINPIKERVYGTASQRKMKQEELCKAISNALKLLIDIDNKDWRLAYVTIDSAIKKKDKYKSLLHLDMHHIYLDVLETVGKYYTKYKIGNLSELKTEMNMQVKLICGALVANKQKISQQQQADIGNELKRLNSIVQLATILDHHAYKASKNIPQVSKAATGAIEAVLTWRVFNEENALETLNKLQDAVKVSGIVGKEERDMVMRAIGLRAGNWYKCPNGHFYCVGECGMARQAGTCIECRTNIGEGGRGVRIQTGFI